MWTWRRSFSSVGVRVISAGSVAVCFENGIELAGFVIFGGFLDELSDVHLRKDVYIVELMILACFVWRSRKKMRRAAVGLVMSVRPSVRPHQRTGH